MDLSLGLDPASVATKCTELACTLVYIHYTYIHAAAMSIILTLLGDPSQGFGKRQTLRGL